MDVTERRSRHHARVAVRVIHLGEEAAEVERERVHAEHSAGDGPLVARTVAIELDAVPLRVGQVERLADEVVGGAAQTPARGDHPAERKREVGARGDEDRQVEKPRRVLRPRRSVRGGLELHERLAVDAERGDRPVLDDLQPDGLLVEPRQPFDVADAEPDRPEPGVGRQLTHRRWDRPAPGRTS